jgi:hypothetical protein
MVIFGIAGADIALAALAYRHDVGATVRARAIVEPWTISIAAAACVLVFPAAADGTRSRDGLIIAYVISVTAGLIASFWPLYRSYGLPPQLEARIPPSSSPSPAATSRSPPPMRSNGARAGSTSPSSACSSRLIGWESIMSASRSPRFRRS